MNIGQILDYMNGVLLKQQQTGRLTPNWYRLILVAINTTEFNRLLAQFERTQEITDDLRVFLVTMGDALHPPLAINQVSGYGLLPDDYVRFAVSGKTEFTATADCGVIYKKRFRKITMLNQDRFNSRKATMLFGGSVQRPIACINGDRFEIDPILQSVMLKYIRRPKTPYYDFIISGGKNIYLPPGAYHDGTNPEAPTGTLSRSVEFEFLPEVHVDLAEKGVVLAGRPQTAQFAIQTSELQKPAQ